jgi:hypothetical protein
MLLEAPEPPSRLVSNSLSPDAVARLVRAATVDVTFDVEPALLLVLALAAAVCCAEAALDVLKRLDRAELWPPVMPPIDIIISRSPTVRSGVIGRESGDLNPTA